MNEPADCHMDAQTIASLDESELLQLIFPHLPTNDAVLLGPGDDCAEVSAGQGSFVVSTDILIEGVHFRTDWSTGYHTGWRAAMQNLADVAAMGAKPTSLVVGLAMPKTTTVAWVTEFARGLGDAARSVGAACVGGDLSSAPTIFISVTVHGDPVHGSVLRATAKEGDVVAFGGNTGWSAAGLELLLQGVALQDLASPTAEAVQLALQTYRAPTSPIGLGALAAAAGATAMMDVSDGLVRDCQRIAKASGVGIVLDYDDLVRAQLPPRPDLRLSDATGQVSVGTSAQGLGLLAELLASSSMGEDSESSALVTGQTLSDLELRVAHWLLTGGEDHGILATFPSLEHVPEGFCKIGNVEPLKLGDAARESQLGKNLPTPAPPQVEAMDVRPDAEIERPATLLGAVRVVGIELGDLRAGWDHFR